MKIKLKHFVPPIFILIYRKIVPKKEKVGIWAGDFTSWEEAQLNCSGYDSDIILEKCKNALLKVKNKEAVYERDSVLFDKIQYSWGLLAGLQKVAIENNNNLNVLDFGGNIGDTVFLISQGGNFPILCVEGNPEYLDLLKCNIAKYPNVELEECFVGNEDKTESGKIVSDGLGTSFIKKETTDNVISYNSLATIISKHNDFADYNLLKIDTDGFDGEIIRGNIANIVKNKPVVFFEYAPTFFQNGIDSELVLFKILSENDYNKLIFYNNIGEMIFVFSLYDEIGIKFAHEYFSRGNRYADIIAFHDNDNNLFEYVLEEENKFLKDFYKS